MCVEYSPFTNLLAASGSCLLDSFELLFLTYYLHFPGPPWAYCMYYRITG